jgi:hypothetical protein
MTPSLFYLFSLLAKNKFCPSFNPTEYPIYELNLPFYAIIFASLLIEKMLMRFSRKYYYVMSIKYYYRMNI